MSDRLSMQPKGGPLIDVMVCDGLGEQHRLFVVFLRGSPKSSYKERHFGQAEKASLSAAVG